MPWSPRKRTLLQAAIIAVAVGWIYWPALRGDWIWDDHLEIVENTALRSPGGLKAIWIAPTGPDYFPLKSSAQWLEWQLWGPNRLGYHLVNVGLHLLGALLVWRMLARLGVRLAWLGGLLFAIHPLAVESVAWIAEFKNTLSLPLVLLAMIACVDYEESGRRSAYAWSLLAFVAALLCKTTVAMFPVVLLGYFWWRRQRIWRGLAASAPFFAAALTLGAVTIHFQERRALAGLDLGLGNIWERLARAGGELGFYLGQIALPHHLMPIYERWPSHALIITGVECWAAAAAVSAVCWAQRDSWGRPALFAFLCFGLSLAPVLGLVPMAYLRIAWVADHFAYLALIPAAGLAAAALGLFTATTAIGVRRAVAAAVAVTGLMLAVEARGLAANYRDGRTFWLAAVRSNPSSWTARTNLGLIRSAAGDYPGAIADLSAAVQIAPDSAEARNDLAAALAASGRPEESLRQYGAAALLAPHNPKIRNNYGAALIAAGMPNAALAEFSAAIAADPGFAAAHQNRGLALARLGQRPQAIAEFETALRLDPYLPEVRRNLALAHAGLGESAGNAGRFEEAAREFRTALGLDPDLPAVHRDLSLALQALGRPAEAARELELSRRPAGDALE